MPSPDTQPNTRRTPLERATFLLLFLILSVYALVEVADFLYPICLAVLFAFLIHPLASFLEINGIHRILANLVSILTLLLILTGAIFVLYQQVDVFINDVPTLKTQARSNLLSLESAIRDTFGEFYTIEEGWLSHNITFVIESGSQQLRSIFATTTGAAARLALLPVYMFFLLFYRDKFIIFIKMLVPKEKHEDADYTIQEISAMVRSYMVGVFTVVFVLCFLNTIGLLIVGVKYAILLGILSAIMNFIPYFGTLIGGAIPLTVALLTESSPRYAVGVLILFVIIQFTENNILTPNITGGSVNINPFTTILSVIVAGLLWGLPGMFIVIPFMGTLRILMKHSPRLQPVAYLIGVEGMEHHRLSISKIRTYFRRRLRGKY
ncbi:MAG TPA: AI-2E family transporter [Cytophagales bacterium]|nr:AI-2E family transporter [Cytophagales bacterium]HAA22973.1 AI-2E family transporter [Cytophagales bacterium]HAP63693.1 AI-2E family transporter [Cytophagales bacterium]